MGNLDGITACGKERVDISDKLNGVFSEIVRKAAGIPDTSPVFDTDVSKIWQLTLREHDNVSVKGIEYLTGLKRLYISNVRHLTDLDLSNNRELRSLTVLRCSIRRIDVSKNKELVCLNVSCNDLKFIDIRHNKKLERLNASSNGMPQILGMAKNETLTHINVSNNLFMGYVNCAGNTKLKELLAVNNSLYDVNVKGCVSLRKLNISTEYQSMLTDLDLSSCEELAVFESFGNKTLWNIRIPQSNYLGLSFFPQENHNLSHYVRPDTSWYLEGVDEFTLNTAEELSGLSKLVECDCDFSGIKILLGQDIVLNERFLYDTEYCQGNGWIRWSPIGGDRDLGEFTEEDGFNGLFDGQGHAITGLFVRDRECMPCGLFGQIAKGGIVRNVEVRGALVKGVNSGIICGFNYGVIDGCSVAGKVEEVASDYAGVFCRYNAGSISNVYVNTRMTTDTALVGDNIGTISNSYISMVIIADGYRHNKVQVGVVGNNRGKIESCYYSVADAGKCTDDAEFGEPGCLRVAHEEMKRQDTYIGWDFENVWGIDKKRNGGYPYLRWEYKD